MKDRIVSSPVLRLFAGSNIGVIQFDVFNRNICKIGIVGAVDLINDREAVAF